MFWVQDVSGVHQVHQVQHPLHPPVLSQSTLLDDAAEVLALRKVHCWDCDASPVRFFFRAVSMVIG